MTEMPEFTDYQRSILIAVFKEGQVRRKTSTANIHPYRRQAKAHKLSTFAFAENREALDELKQCGLITIRVMKARPNAFSITLTKEGLEVARVLTDFTRL